ncbi:hypothetical protein Hanom_Chr06g00533391 [Helianthus anomalus]
MPNCFSVYVLEFYSKTNCSGICGCSWGDSCTLSPQVILFHNFLFIWHCKEHCLQRLQNYLDITYDGCSIVEHQVQ